MLLKQQSSILNANSRVSGAAGIDVPDDGASPVRVLARGLTILRVFTPKNNWLFNHEIADAAKLPRSTVSRLSANLAEAGYLEYSQERGQYRLGVCILALGYAALTNVDIFETARPYMQQLADTEDALVVLATRDGFSMVCNEVCYGRNMLTLRVSVGSELSLLTSAVGRALIGSLPEEQGNALIGEIRKRFKEEWARLGPALEDARRQIRSKKFFISIGTLEHGVNGVGTVLDIDGAPCTYVLGIAAPLFRFKPQILEQRVGPRMLELRHNIEKVMITSKKVN